MKKIYKGGEDQKIFVCTEANGLNNSVSVSIMTLKTLIKDYKDRENSIL